VTSFAPSAPDGGHVRGHHPEERSLRADLHDRPQRLDDAAARELGERALHRRYQIVHLEETADGGFGEE
jgi:hypothetical protein